jgi:glycosyltransferase involved in cell wall biosynthesis
MRILVPTHSAFVVGGIGAVASGLVPAMRASLRPGEEVAVASPRAGGGGLTAALPTIGRPSGAIARMAYEQLALPRLAAACTSVHLCDSRPILASRRPFVLSVHDVTYLDEPGWYEPGAATYKRIMLAAAIAKRPAAIVCDSRHTRDRLLAHHPRAARLDVRVVAPGFAAPPADRPRRQPATSEPYFLTVSTLEPRKNHLGLLRAFRAARARGLDLRWKVAGGDGHRSEPIRAALEAEDGVDVLGWVTPAALEELFAGAMFLALPSHVEGFGMTPLEAMARDVPTICSSGSGLDDAVGDAGLRVAADDVAGWTAGLLHLQDNPGERARYVAAGRSRVGGFSWAKAANGVLNVHRVLACGSTRSR